MAKKQQLLTLHRLHEVSLVDDPANEDANVLLFKRGQKAPVQSGGVAGVSGGVVNKGDNDMDDVTKKAIAELEKALGMPLDKAAGAIADLQKSLKDTTALVTTLKAKADMSDGEKEYCGGLSDTQKEKFMGMDSDARKKFMKENPVKKVKDEDGDILKIGDRIIKRSVVGDDQFEVMKSQEARIIAQDAAIAKASEDSEVEKFRQEGETILKNLGGEPIAKAKALRAISKLPEEVAKTVRGWLEAGNKAMTELTKERGAAGGGQGGSAEEELQKRAKDRATKDGITYSKAYDLICQESPDLYEKYNVEKAAAQRTAVAA